MYIAGALGSLSWVALPAQSVRDQIAELRRASIDPVPNEPGVSVSSRLANDLGGRNVTPHHGAIALHLDAARLEIEFEKRVFSEPNPYRSQLPSPTRWPKLACSFVVFGNVNVVRARRKGGRCGGGISL